MPARCQRADAMLKMRWMTLLNAWMVSATPGKWESSSIALINSFVSSKKYRFQNWLRVLCCQKGVASSMSAVANLHSRLRAKFDLISRNDANAFT